MKKFMRHLGIAVRQEWRKVMNSTKRSMSLGAQYLARMMPWARGENWRKKDHKK